MLCLSDTPINDVLPFFVELGIPVAFLVPTPTGYGKSIMDAIGSLRLFLKENKIHDYESQEQGPKHKVLFPAYFVHEDKLEKTEASLYRPLTKQGDPRIWFKNLKSFCEPCNLLAITYMNSCLYVFNMSIMVNRGSFAKAAAHFNIAEKVLGKDDHTQYEPEQDSNIIQTITNIHATTHCVADELLRKLRHIHSHGYVESIGYGDTTVGMTLENLLEIEPNNDRAPDYKGIEIKTLRDNLIRKGHKQKKIARNLITLFTQVPQWSNSPYSAKQILDIFGYIKEGRKQLYCTVNSIPNNQGLFFVVDEDKDLLQNFAQTKSNPNELIAIWNMQKLRNELAKKHKETFWIKASVDIRNGKEYFRYDSVLHTKKPNISLLGHLINSDIISLDYTLSQKSSGGVRDHGYLFRIKSSEFDMLFPSPKSYDLSLDEELISN